MLSYPHIDPVLVSLGPLSIRWYGLAYLAAFLAAMLLGSYRARQEDRRICPFSREEVRDLLPWGIIGAVLGARLGYVLFYNPLAYLENPAEILAVWHGGMSFHGGLLGVVCAVWRASRRYKTNLRASLDFVAPLAPPGLFFGRLGNFINAELWGRPTDMPWGMIFPGREAGPLPRHPSQLYEAGLEGLTLFIALWAFSSRPRPPGAVAGLFALLYGIFRLFMEFFREPDRHLGFLLGGVITMGMLLSLPLIAVGILLLQSGWNARPHRADARAGAQPYRKTRHEKRG